ncbi:T9SS type A sorting domain-containing protein, partial [candidate division KSB1 bacterium]|nr:T9SS type A sorting domain-containing protein [candidate division KSB1 bacterium]
YTVQTPEETCYIFDGACDGNQNYWGFDDITAWFKILWDDDHVYFALKKIDNEYKYDATHMTSLGNIWNDDAYQIILDANAPDDLTGPMPSAEIGLALLDYTETAYTSWRNTNGDPLALADGNGVSAIEDCDGKAFFATQTENEDGSYTEVMEVAFVKWGEIVADEAQMMSIEANDLDEDHTVDALQWSRGIFHGKLPERYASIVYSSSAPSAVADKKPALPSEFTMQQNYPNPFNPTTTISYALNKTGMVELNVYDLSGHKVATLVAEMQNAGDHHVTFDSHDLPSGVYIYSLKSGLSVLSNKMVLMR